MGDLVIDLAIDRYDRHMPFFDGTVNLPDNPKIRVLQVGQTTTLRDGTDRHERMLQDGAFDAAETSLASYIAAKAQGLPFTAIPVFPRRLFSQGQIFVNSNSGIESPRDLEGRIVALQSFQTTLAVLAKGDLASEYGVDLGSVAWRVKTPDAVATENWGRFDIAALPDGADLTDQLCTGAVDALFYSRTPTPPPALAGNIRRLFSEHGQEEARFVQRNGYWPIMHLVALKESSVANCPELPAILMKAFENAEAVSAEYLADPNWSRMPWAKYTTEAEAGAFPQNLWASGLQANRANLARFIGYASDQGFIDRKMEPEDLFHPSVRNS
jgi:4,5-dihydroxyphthalate decarboxylase